MYLKSTTKRKGFTLVEILVVIAVVSVLAALLFAVFARVREAGRRTACASNLKQLALGMQQYVGDNNGRYPPARGPGSATPQEAVRLFVMNGPLGWHYSIFPYIKNVEVFRCPTHPADSSDRRGKGFNPAHPLELLEPIDYDLNWLHLNRPITLFTVGGRKEANVIDPAHTWLNTDYVVDSPANEGLSACGRPVKGDTLHSGGANYSFCDGHVKWLTPKAASDLECSSGNSPFLPSQP